MNNKKIITIIEILVVIGAFLYILIVKSIPEFKKEFGSSDSFFNYKKYNSMYEFIYDDGCDFIIVLDDKRKVYHMMFFDKNSISLYNRKIEGKLLDKAISNINDITSNKTLLKVIYYGDTYLDEIKSLLSREDIIYDSSTIKDKATLLGININSDDVMLQDIDYYSKEIVRIYKKDFKDTSSDGFETYADNVYLKIEEYMNNNSISDLDTDNSLLLIETIPADKDLKYYPSSDSWYYIKDGKIYAYIEFNDNNVGYCYKGSIDLRSEGKC